MQYFGHRRAKRCECPAYFYTKARWIGAIQHGSTYSQAGEARARTCTSIDSTLRGVAEGVRRLLQVAVRNAQLKEHCQGWQVYVLDGYFCRAEFEVPVVSRPGHVYMQNKCTTHTYNAHSYCDHPVHTYKRLHANNVSIYDIQGGTMVATESVNHFAS